MTRRVTWAKSEQDNASGVVVTVDAGSSLLGEYVTLKSEGAVMVEGMNMAHYDAMAVGRMDALLGLDVLRACQELADFELLSANLVAPDTGELLFAPYTIIERDGAKIGIIGISDEEVVELPDMRGVAAYIDATEATRQYVDELRDQVDVIIVLSRLGTGENAELAEAVPGINIIVGGKTRRLLTEPERIGDTLITEMSYNGERGGKLTVFIGADGVPYDYAEQAIPLTDAYPGDPEAEEMVQRYIELYPTPTPAQ